MLHKKEPNFPHYSWTFRNRYGNASKYVYFQSQKFYWCYHLYSPCGYQYIPKNRRFLNAGDASKTTVKNLYSPSLIKRNAEIGIWSVPKIPYYLILQELCSGKNIEIIAIAEGDSPKRVLLCFFTGKLRRVNLAINQRFGYQSPSNCIQIFAALNLASKLQFSQHHIIFPL